MYHSVLTGSYLRNSSLGSTMGAITELLAEVRQGNHQALDQLMQLVYPELRRIAARYMGKERPDHTLQATALVHEAYLRLVDEKSLKLEDHTVFFAAAARVMRNLLVDHARARLRVKRGGNGKIQLDSSLTLAVCENDELLALEEALKRLEHLDSRSAHIVELRYFGGLSNEEIASLIGISVRTVKREWQMAKAWLYGQIRGGI
jgi:RNA polymerase sigma-70 factor, ECF subfamily